MNLKDEMIKRHSHAEIENDINPSSIVYKEEDVIELMKLVRNKSLEWAADNGKANYCYSYVEGHYAVINKDSILIGKEIIKI